MAVLGIAAVGAAIGGTIGANVAGISVLAAASAGWAVGSAVGSYLFREGPPRPQNSITEGPRLVDLIVRGGSYGADIPRVWGSFRVGGLIIWKPPLREERIVISEEIGGGGGGGKGGKGGGGGSAIHTRVSYKYHGSCALLICEGPALIKKVWMNSKLAYDAGAADPGFAAPYLTVYSGDDTQLPDPAMEAYEGVGNVPAYRGLCYVVVDDLPLEDFGYSLPNFEVEVSRIESTACTATGLQSIGNVSSGENGIAFPGRYGALGYPTAVFNWLGVVTTSGPGGLRNLFLRRITSASDGTETARFPDDGSNGRFVGQWTAAATEYRTFEGSRYASAGNQTTPAVIWDIEEDIVYDTGTVGADLYFVDFDWSNFAFDRYIYLVPGFTDRWWYIPEQYDGPDDFTVVVFTMRKEIPPEPAGLYVIKLVEFDLTFPPGFEPNASFDHPFPLVSPGGIPYVCSTKTGISGANVTLYEVDLNELGATTPRWWSIGTFRDALRYGCVLGACFITHGGTAAGHADYACELDRSLADGSALVPVTQLRTTATVFPQLLAVDLSHLLYDHVINDVQGVSTEFTAPLASIIRDTCEQAGLAAADFDVSSISKEIIGYARTGQMAARSAIAGVSNICPINAVESGGKIVWTSDCEKDHDTGITILEDDLGAHPYGNATPDRLLLQRVQELEMPREVQITFSDQQQDYDTGTHRAFNPITESSSVLSFQIPAALTAVDAKAAAQRVMDAAITDRVTASFELQWKHLILEPGDVLRVEARTATYTVRLTQVSLSPVGVLSCRGVVYDATALDQTPTADTPPGPAVTPTIIPSAAILFNIPVLRAVDAPYHGIHAIGYSVGALSGPDWPGAELFQSSVPGWLLGTYWSKGREGSQGLVDVLPATVTRPWVWDDTSALEVTLSAGALTSATDLDVQNGLNQFAIGAEGRWEIGAFVNAQSLGGNSYRLTRLLRGRRGTEQHIGSTLVGDRFLLLDTVGCRRVTLSVEDIGNSRNYRLVPEYSKIAVASDIPFTSSAVDQIPFAPVRLEGTRVGGDLRLNWQPRSRTAIEQLMGESEGHGEATERYDLELRISGGTAILRTIVTATYPVVYSLAAYKADSGDSGATTVPTLDVTVYQYSQTVGRGQPTAATI